MNYHLLSYRAVDGSARAGIKVAERVHDLAAVSGKPEWSTVQAVLDAGDNGVAGLADATRRAQDQPGQSLAETTLLAPLQNRATIWCAGANYYDHVEEMSRVHNVPTDVSKLIGNQSFHFQKSWAATVVGPGHVTPVPRYTEKLDWELELGAVIGKPASNVKAADALSYVFGYTIANDLSARDHTNRPEVQVGSPFKADWTAQKSFDGACPIGPWITPAAQIADPQNLPMKLWVNDELMQDAHTKHMIFSLATQIENLSRRITLLPGDLILTGTGVGVGAARGKFLKPGDELRLWAENIGEFSHSIGAKAA